MTALLAAVLLFVAVAPEPAARGAPSSAGGLFARSRSLWSRASARWPTRAARSAQFEAIPQALEMLARALRGGASLLTALEAVAAELPEADLSQVVRRVRGGLGLSESLDDWVNDSAERRAAAALLVLGHTSGAAMASSLDRAAASLRQRRALGEEIRALTSQTRASGVVVAAAPCGFAALVAIVDHDVLRSLFVTPAGLASLAIGLALECVGVWWMAQLSKGVAQWA